MSIDSGLPAGGVRRPNIYDVADRAGVSHMTVSRVLNGHPNIRDSTRARVLRAIDELDYRRSTIARALVTKQTMRIGVLVDGTTQFGPNSTVHAIETAAHEHGYFVSTFSISDDERRTIDAGVVDLLAQGVDALCLIAPRSSSLDLLRRRPLGLPILVVKEGVDAENLTAAVDQRAGARAAVGHLIDLGHRVILHLAGPPDWFDAQARSEAWRAELVAAGLEVHEPAIGDWSSDSGYVFGRTHDLGEATAVFVANDQMALGVIHGLAERGIRVPEDVSVVGFDDLPDAKHFLPPLTTVRQDFAALGRAVIQALVRAVNGGEGEEHGLIEPILVVRSSTASPR